MRNLKIYNIFILLFFVGLSISAQNAREWRVDSLSTVKSGIPQWQVDSLKLADTQDANQWSVDSLKLYPAVAYRVYEEDEYKPYAIANLEDRVDLTLAGMGVFSDGDYAPFWMTNNQHGIGSAYIDKQYLRLNAFAYKKISISGNSFGLSGGVDILAANNLSSDFYIQQLYVDFAYKSLVLSVGAKERNSLLKNPDLSSGGLTLSANARPIPQIELSMPDFVSIPNTNDKFQIMGGLSYGWFGDDQFKRDNSADKNYAESVLYHRKYGFLRFKPNRAWSFIAGLEMDTQWGGRFYKDGINWYSGSASLKDFFKVLIPMSGGSDSNITDQVNIVGNVYGSMHFIVNYKKDDFGIKAYHEHFFEDHSGLAFKNIPDGLYGIEVNLNKMPWLSSILFEYLHTKNQSGPFLWDATEGIPVQVSGGDNYYNHVDFISLSNYGYVMGNPLFTSPIYNRGQSLTVYNTRLSSFHFGISGSIIRYLDYRLLTTYSRSWGTPLIPSSYIRDQFSGMAEVKYNGPALAGWFLSGAFAYDKSQMVGDNTGIQLKVSKTFCIR